MQHDILAYLRKYSISRRHFVRASAMAGTLTVAGTLAPANIAGFSLGRAAAQEGGDLGILNYALTLEHLENALYKALLSSGLLTGKALEFATAFGAHESTHVTALTDTITKLGGTPVKAQAAYSFPALKTEAEVIKTLADVEDLGASAYLGAAPLIKSGDLLTVAVQIHTNEAQHATAFRFLAGLDPVPFAFAPAASMADVVKAVTPFLGSGTAAPAPGTPATMPNTGDGDNSNLLLLGIGGAAAVAAGAAILKNKQSAASE